MECTNCNNPEWCWIFKEMEGTNIMQLDRTCNECLSKYGWFKDVDEYGRCTGRRGDEALRIVSMGDENVFAEYKSPYMVLKVISR